MQSERVLNQDSFGQAAQFNFPDGQATHRSAIGACLSVMVLLATLLFLSEEIYIMYDHGNSSFGQTLHYNHFTMNDTFTEEDGF